MTMDEKKWYWEPLQHEGPKGSFMGPYSSYRLLKMLQDPEEKRVGTQNFRGSPIPRACCVFFGFSSEPSGANFVSIFFGWLGLQPGAFWHFRVKMATTSRVISGDEISKNYSVPRVSRRR